MKWLSAGLVFVNLSTVCGLLLGMAGNGLNERSAMFALVAGVAFAVAAYLGVPDPAVPDKKVNSPVTKQKRSKSERRGLETVAQESASSLAARYRHLWLWLMAACFAVFALRSFCWLLYIDGDELKIQSPNNLGDLALHITLIRNFASGVALWPDNPIYVFSKLRYPAGMDLFNGLLYLIHVDLTRGLVWTGLLASLATFYAFFRWAGAFGIAAFLFNGGIAGFEFFRALKILDYQDSKTIAWKSIALSMFLTQRGLLYAIPAGLLLLYQWRARFFARSDQAKPDLARPPLPFWVECSLYASMPLFHLHTFMALSILLSFWFLVGRPAIRKQLLLLAGCALLPATFFVWLVTDQFRARHILEWKPDWVQTDGDFARPFFEFWGVNFGITIPLILLLIGVCSWRFWKSDARSVFNLPTNLAFLIPAAAIFLFACNVKTAPWYWDNMKLIIWAYFIVLPFLWQDLIAKWPIDLRICICVALFWSGFISLIGGLATGAPGFGFANRAELDAVGDALRRLPVEARFAAYPTYNHPLLLQGRKVALGYSGHLWSQGFADYTKPYNLLNQLMQGAQNWREIARILRVRYIFWGREERTNYPASNRPWEATAALVASGSWGAIYDLEPAAHPLGR
jgi:hypothetical protein